MLTHHFPQMKKSQPAPSRHSALPIPETSEAPSLLIPDAVLPEQFFSLPEHSAGTSGQVALMRAVLHDAIECYQKQFFTPAPRVQRLAKEAEAWLFSDDERWPFAFVNICAVLGMEPEYIRSGLRRARQLLPTQTRRKIRHASPVRRFRRMAA